MEEFTQDYERTARFSLIKTHAHYFMRVHGNMIRKVERVFASLHRGINYKHWKHTLMNRLAQIEMVHARSYTLATKGGMKKSESLQSLGSVSGSQGPSVREFLGSEVVVNSAKGGPNAP